MSAVATQHHSAVGMAGDQEEAHPGMPAEPREQMWVTCFDVLEGRPPLDLHQRDGRRVSGVDNRDVLVGYLLLPPSGADLGTR